MRGLLGDSNGWEADMIVFQLDVFMAILLVSEKLHKRQGSLQ